MEKGNEGYKKGLWTEEEDKILAEYVNIHGKGQWNSVSKRTGLNRCGKSCRLRWINYLNPGIKRGLFSQDEQDLIIRLHTLLGNRWSLIAGRVPGRTDNQVKNYWNSHLSKKLKLGIHKEPTPRKTVVVGGDGVTTSTNNNKTSTATATPTGRSEFDETSSVHSRDCSGSAAPMPMPLPEAQGYAANSCLWVSDFDGLMGDHPACYMDLLSGTADSFHLDWDHL